MPVSDEALVASAMVDRDPGAFETLVGRYQSRVRGWLRHLGKDEALADDLAQETFLKAWRKLATYKGQGSFEGWLLTIARNQFLQHCRKTGRENAHMERLETEATADGAADDVLFHQGEGRDADRFLAILDSDERDVMILVYGIGLSHSEASKVAGLPLGTVKSHVRRSVMKIRQQFGLEEFIS